MIYTSVTYTSPRFIQFTVKGTCSFGRHHYILPIPIQRGIHNVMLRLNCNTPLTIQTPFIVPVFIHVIFQMF